MQAGGAGVLVADGFLPQKVGAAHLRLHGDGGLHALPGGFGGRLGDLAQGGLAGVGGDLGGGHQRVHQGLVAGGRAAQRHHLVRRVFQAGGVLPGAQFAAVAGGLAQLADHGGEDGPDGPADAGQHGAAVGLEAVVHRRALGQRAGGLQAGLGAPGHALAMIAVADGAVEGAQLVLVGLEGLGDRAEKLAHVFLGNAVHLCLPFHGPAGRLPNTKKPFMIIT